MSVRAKLLTGYLVFVGALVLLGGWSAVRLNQMGGVSRNIIAENYDSVVAAQDMKESLERQDSAALFILQGERERASSQLREHRARFDRALEKAANNITEQGEREVVNSIRQERDAYFRVFDRFISETSSGAAASLNTNRGRALYFGELEPLFSRLRASCDDLLRLNQEAMQAKSKRQRASPDDTFCSRCSSLARSLELELRWPSFLRTASCVRCKH